MIVYGTSILQDRWIYSCFCNFIPYLGAMLWYVVKQGGTYIRIHDICRAGEILVQLWSQKHSILAWNRNASGLDRWFMPSWREMVCIHKSVTLTTLRFRQIWFSSCQKRDVSLPNNLKTSNGVLLVKPEGLFIRQWSSLVTACVFVYRIRRRRPVPKVQNQVYHPSLFFI